MSGKVMRTVSWQGAMIPLIGIAVAAAIPLVVYALRDRHERTAIETVRQLQQVQDAFRARSGGYASEVASLLTACAGEAVPFKPEGVRALERAGYRLTLRPARGATTTGQDCHGRPLVSDYYVAAAPETAGTIARQAVAGHSSRGLFLFFDGVAPLEQDIASGLATPVEARESFTIP